MIAAASTRAGQSFFCHGIIITQAPFAHPKLPTLNESGQIPFGEIRLLPLGPGEKANVTIEPAKGFNVGDGPRKRVEREVIGGTVGLILDGRGRPLEMPTDRNVSRPMITEWVKALELYPSGEGCP